MTPITAGTLGALCAVIAATGWLLGYVLVGLVGITGVLIVSPMVWRG